MSIENTLTEESKILNLPRFETFEEIENILQSKLDNYPQINTIEEFKSYSPWDFKDMKKAIDLIVNTMSQNKKIVFVFDCDADGMGTYTITYLFFSKFFKYDNLEFVVTKRADGYGFTPMHVMEHPAGEGGLYITADNGITAKEATEYALRSGANVIINDHHTPDYEKCWPLWHSNKPEEESRVAIVDPCQRDCEFGKKDMNISGTVVLYYMLEALAQTYKLDVDLYHEMLPEIAYTTIADVMKINQGLSRYFVKDFLNNGKIYTTDRQYIKTFLKEKELTCDKRATAEDFGFGFSPLLNATNRLTSANDGINFLIQDTEDYSKQWWDYISKINDTRKEKQQKLLDYVEFRFKDYMPSKKNGYKLIMIPGQFNQEAKGLLGIVAGRLSDKYKVPCIVLNLNEEKTAYSGSGRSVGTIDILSHFRKEHILKFLTHVGGHKQALGLGVKAGDLEEFFTEVQKEFSTIPEHQFMSDKKATGFIDIKDISEDLISTLDKFEPFGHYFYKPDFVTKAIVKNANEIGKQKNHLSMTIQDESGNLSFKALNFFHEYTPKKGDSVYLYFKPELETYRGNTKIVLKVSRIVPCTQE
jgi:single-stranded-DNA-specific exonuclease